MQGQTFLEPARKIISPAICKAVSQKCPTGTCNVQEAHHELVAHLIEIGVDGGGGRLVLHADLHLALVQRFACLHDPGHARPPANTRHSMTSKDIYHTRIGT